MQFLADRIVVGAELDQLAQLRLELAVLFPQRNDLPFGDRNCMPAVRMRHIDLGKQIGVLLEEFRVLLKIIGDRLGVHPCFLVGFIGHASTCHSPSNTVVAGPVISTGSPGPSQRIASSPPRVRTRTVRIEQAATDSGYNGSAGARAAGQSLAGAPLPHAQTNVSAIDDLHVTGIDPARKMRMTLEQRTLGGDRRRFDVGDDLHRVRVAHRQCADRHQLAGDVESLRRRCAVTDERNRVSLEAAARPCRPEPARRLRAWAR